MARANKNVNILATLRVVQSGSNHRICLSSLRLHMKFFWIHKKNSIKFNFNLNCEDAIDLPLNACYLAVAREVSNLFYLFIASIRDCKVEFYGYCPFKKGKSGFKRNFHAHSSSTAGLLHRTKFLFIMGFIFDIFMEAEMDPYVNTAALRIQWCPSDPCWNHFNRVLSRTKWGNRALPKQSYCKWIFRNKQRS